MALLTVDMSGIHSLYDDFRLTKPVRLLMLFRPRDRILRFSETEKALHRQLFTDQSANTISISIIYC